MQAEREREQAADRAARLTLREQQRRRELVRSLPGLGPKKCRASVPRSTQSSHRGAPECIHCATCSRPRAPAAVSNVLPALPDTRESSTHVMACLDRDAAPSGAQVQHASIYEAAWNLVGLGSAFRLGFTLGLRLGSKLRLVQMPAPWPLITVVRCDAGRSRGA